MRGENRTGRLVVCLSEYLPLHSVSIKSVWGFVWLKDYCLAYANRKTKCRNYLCISQNRKK